MHSYRFAKFSASNANIQNRVRAAFDNTDGFHGGVDENRLGAGQPHGSKILLEGLFCVCHAVSLLGVFGYTLIKKAYRLLNVIPLVPVCRFYLLQPNI